MPVEENSLPTLSHHCLHALGTAQRHIVEALSKAGELDVSELAIQLGVSRSAVRQHMARLVDENLVSFREVPMGRRGRPRRVFALTARARNILPTSSEDLALALFYEIIEAKPEIVEPMLRNAFLNAANATAAVLPANPSRDSAIAAFAQVLDRADFLPSIERGETDDEYRVTLAHCPLLSLASSLDAVCASEVEGFQVLLPGAHVERDQHRLKGDTVCRYRIRLPAPVQEYVRAG